MKTNDQLILHKYISLPEKLQEEVEDFIDFLLFKQQKKENKSKNKKKTNFGSAKGLIVIKTDFDQPIEDFKDYM